MSFIADAMRLIYEKAEALSALKKPNLFQIPGVRNVVYVDYGGKLEKHDVNIPVRTDTIMAIADLKKVIEDVEVNDRPTKLCLWIDGEEVKLILDNDAHRQNYVNVPLVKTQIHRFIARHIEPQRYDAEAFIRLLRREFANSGNQLQTLTAIRNVKWKAIEEDSQMRSASQDTLGVVNDAEVTYGQGDLPDSLLLTAELFSNPYENQAQEDFAFSIDVDKVNKKFILQVDKDQYDAAVWRAVANIRTDLEAVYPELPIFYG